MSISSMILRTRPEKAAEVRERVSLLEGVEVHETDREGVMVVTIDQPDNVKATDALVALQHTEGVINTSLIYNYFEEGDPGDQVLHQKAG